MSWLAGKTCVVTGAGRGIGAATALALAGGGAARVVVAARDASAIESVAAKLRQAGCDGVAVPCDVASASDVDAVFDAAGAVDALVCAAGMIVKGRIDELSESDWRRCLEVNLTGTFLCCARALASMRDGGRIITIGSLSGVPGTEKFPGLGAYNASKYGVAGLTEMIAVEGRDRGVTAICVSPGAVDTAMLREAAPHLRPGLMPADVGRLIAGLLGEAMTPLSGSNIPLFSNL